MELEEVYDKVLPPQFDNTFKRATGYAIPDIINYDVPPSNPSNEYDNRYNKIHFTINSSNLLDPYSLILNLSVENRNQNAIQLDHSAHSLISQISVFSNGKEIEKVKDYDLMMSMYFDMELTRDQRGERRTDEGFGTNEYGTNELILHPQNSKSYNFNVMSDILDYHNVESYYNAYKENGGDLGSIKTLERTDLKKTVNKDVTIKLKEQSTTMIKSFNEDVITNCNQWDYVVDGKLSPFPYGYSDVGNRNKYNFKIPLFLRSLGFGIPPNNYKLIPLELFGALTIVVTLNPYAFFVPVTISEANYFNLYTRNEDYLKACVNIDNPSTNYYCSKALLSTRQLRFHPAIHNRILDKVRNGEWISDYIELELLAQNYYIPNKSGPNITYTRSIEKSSIKAIYITFTNDLYKHTPYARKLVRYNKGIKSISFKQAGLEFPKPTHDERNSLKSHGENNGSYFYEQMMNCIAKTYDNSGLVINRRSYHIDFDFSHVIGLMHLKNRSSKIVSEFRGNLYDLLVEFKLFDDRWVKHYTEYSLLTLAHNDIVPPFCSHLKVYNPTAFTGVMKQVQSKTIYALNFEPTPGSGVAYKTSISTSFNIPFLIEMERVPSYHTLDTWNKVNDVYFIQNVFFEVYTTIQMSPYGEFIKI